MSFLYFLIRMALFASFLPTLAHAGTELNANIPSVTKNTGLSSSPSPPRPSTAGKGTVTGLPIPRFVSLKSNRVNLRTGPGRDYPTTWVFEKIALPVEIIAEFDTWRRIRDSEGTEGWVLHSLLSGKRTALVIPWSSREETIPLHQSMDDSSSVVAHLKTGVLLSLKKCSGVWCSVHLLSKNGRYEGYVKQEKVWGAYPQEEVK